MLNPNALMFWLLGSGVGYLLDGTHGAVVGLVVTVGFSALVGIINEVRTW